jgi:hypothetical protein
MNTSVTITNQKTKFDELNMHFDHAGYLLALCTIHAMIAVVTLMELHTSCALKYQAFLICFMIMHTLTFIFMMFGNTVVSFSSKLLCTSLSFSSWGLFIMFNNGTPKDGHVAFLISTLFALFSLLYSVIAIVSLFIQSCSNI